MKSQIIIAFCLSLVGHIDAFHPLSGLQRRRISTPPLLSYLDSLQEPAPQQQPFSAPTTADCESSTPPRFSYAPLAYFGLDKLVSKGPRPTADWGTPEDASRKLDDDGVFRVGSWWCSEGGWPSPNGKATTEVFYMVSGHGCLSDSDGAKHYFGPGDTVIIPKGHTGRWDVFEPIHKIWAVNAHEHVEERTSPVRVRVDHYHTYSPDRANGPQTQDPLYGGPGDGHAAWNTFYDVGPNKVGIWTGEPGTIPVSYGSRAFFHVVEGVVFVTDEADGTARRCVAGDTVMLPAGWSGHIDIVEKVKKVWVTAD